MSAPLPTDKRIPGQVAAEAFYHDDSCYQFAPTEWNRAAAAVLEHCTPVITTEQHAALLRRIADQQRALDEAWGNLAIVARMLANAVGRERG